MPTQLFKAFPLNTFEKVLKSEALNGGQKIVQTVKYSIKGTEEAREIAYTHVRDSIASAKILEVAQPYIDAYEDDYRGMINWTAA